MSPSSDRFRTGGALQGAAAASLLRERQRAAELKPGASIGLYRVIEELCRGGMAIVYRAERADGEYQQQVALKWMLDPQPDAASEALFRRERQALADLRHPHIARLLDGGRGEDGRPWLAMELIEGQRLDQHCVSQKLPPERRLALFGQVCAAVAFAHARGIIHRDIKPSNVLVDADGSAKLLDFGISQLLGHEDQGQELAFTPGFASPEQVRGEPATVASDVFQLGVMLAVLMSPSDAAHRALLDTVATSSNALDAPAFAVPDGLPRDLAAIIAKATHRDPALRHAGASMLAADVEALLQKRPVSARRRSASYVFGRFLQRHPFAMSATTLLILASLGMALAFTLKLQEERDVAQLERDRAEAINRFLNEDVLDAANPMRRAPGQAEMTVREALDGAADRVDERFATQPRTARQVYATLARLRYEFGEFEAAKGLFERALSLPAIDTRDQIELRRNAGTVLLSMQDHEHAIPELESLAVLARAQLGESHPETLRVELALLQGRARLNTEESALPAMEELRERAARALGELNEIGGQLDLAIADHFRMRGRPELAIDNARRALAALRETRGVDHPSTLKAQVMLGHAHNANGDAEAGIAALREAVSLQRARFGPDDGDSLFMQNELAFVLAGHERFDEAEPLFDETVRLWGQRWGEESIQITPMLSNLANTRLRLGRKDEALALFQRAIAVLDANPDAPVFLRSILLRGTGDALRELGRLDEAESALNRGLEAADAGGLGNDDLRRLALRGALARVQLARGELQAGAEQLGAVVAELRQQVPDTHALLRPLLRELTVIESQGRDTKP